MNGKIYMLKPPSAITSSMVHSAFESKDFITKNFSDTGFPFTTHVTF